jgi:hypothetical protein
MKECEMGGSCGTFGKKGNGCRVFIGKPGERGHLEVLGVDG